MSQSTIRYLLFYLSQILCSLSCLLIFLVLANKAMADLSIESVYPNVGQVEKEMSVSIKGKDFNKDTKVSISLDTSNVKNIVGSIDLPGTGSDVKVVKPFAYVAAGQSGLQVIDISSPESPEIITSVETQGSAHSITVKNQYVYVTVSDGILEIIDISIPSNPIPIGTLKVSGNGNDIIVVDQIAYVTLNHGRFLSIDVSDPSKPIILGSVKTSGLIKEVDIMDQYAFVVGKNGLQAVDISNPSNPIIIGSKKELGFANDIEVIDKTAYVTTYKNVLQVVDVSLPSDPKIIGSIEGIDNVNVHDLVVVDKLAYLTTGNSGLHVIDVHDTEDIKIIGSTDTLGRSESVNVVDKLAYVVNSFDNSLVLLDISKPSNPATIGSLDTQGEATDIELLGQTVYLADRVSGLHAISVQNLSDPCFIGSFNAFDTAYNLKIKGQTAYVASGRSGLQIIDISNSEYLSKVCAIDTPGYAYDVSVEDDIAYVADYTSGLQLIDISNPKNSKIIKTLNSFDGAMDIAVKDHIAYVADFKGLQIIDISKPEDPIRLGSLDIQDNLVEIKVVEEMAYLTTENLAVNNPNDNGLIIIDVSEPKKPTITGSVTTPGNTGDFIVEDNTVYMSDGTNGVQVIDVSTASEPTIIGWVDTPGSAYGLKLANHIAYVADGKAGLSIVPIPKMLTNIVAKDSTELKLTLVGPDIAGDYNIRVFDDSEADQLNGALSFMNSTEHEVQRHKKAIIASGGSLKDRLSSAAKKCSNWAYLALLAQGYSKDNIRYLSPHDLIDVDGDGNNDVNNICTTSTLSSAIQDWAAKDASELIIYLIDHGGQGTFQANQGEVINAADLDCWLDNLHSSIPGKIILIYDACYSGSFLPHMTTPTDGERIVITSSGPDEETWFMEEGVMSFGYQFWSSVFGNAKLYDSYQVATGMIENSQTPILDANGDAQETEEDVEIVSDFLIGRGRVAASGPPRIGTVIARKILSGQEAATLWAKDIRALNELNRVWAIIIPPDYERTYTGEAVTNLDTVELIDPDGDGTYTGSYNKFVKQGTYKVEIHARDSEDFFSLPRITQVIQTEGELISQDPIPDIQVNGLNGPLTVKPSDTISVTISLKPGSRESQNSDWWLATINNLGEIKSLVIEPQVDWVDGIERLIAWPLVDVSLLPIPDPTLSRGKNYVVFAVDNNVDTIPDLSWWDYVEVNVQ